MNVSPTIWDYSQSNINETLLLQSIQNNTSQKNKPNKLTSLFQDLKEGETIASKEKQLVFDFFSELSVTANSNIKQIENNQESHQKIQDLYNICSNLMSTLQKLQSKIQKMEEKNHQKNSFQKESAISASQNVLQSVLTYQNQQKSKQCKCEHSKEKQMAIGLFEAWNVRQKIQTYKQENEQLKKQIIRLEVGNQELKKSYKKIQSQNIKLRELLKQYQSFNKKLITQRQSDNKLERNSSNKLLSYRQFTHSKSNTFSSQDQGLPQSYRIKIYNENDYYTETIQQSSSRILKKQKSFDQVNQKYAVRTKQVTTFAQIPRRNQMNNHFQDEKSYLKSFQQCRRGEPLGNFVGNATPVGSKYSPDLTPSTTHLSFYGLKHKVHPYNEYSMKQNQSPLKPNSNITIGHRQRN